MHFNGAVCSALNSHLFILPDGKVTICEQLYWNPRFIIGDAKKSGLKRDLAVSGSIASLQPFTQRPQQTKQMQSLHLF